MGFVLSIAPTELDKPEVFESTQLASPWVVIVWNDPVNLQSYVCYVFQTYFGMPEPRAHTLMLQVHNEGRAAVISGNREEMERHVEALHGYGLWATMQRSDE